MRLFVALTPPARLQRELERQAVRFRGLCRGGRLVPRENLHLTLAFLGETDRRPAVEAAMTAAAGAPFVLRTAPPGRFPGKRGDLWWMGVEEAPPLLALRRRLVRALGEAGVWLDDAKPSRPHITLGRDLRPEPGADLRAWAAGCPPRSWRVETLTLMESRPNPGGAPRYIPLFHCPLREREYEKEADVPRKP